VLKIQEIWEMTEDLPEYHLRRGDEVVELADGRHFRRRNGAGGRMADFFPLVPSQSQQPDEDELHAAVQEHRLRVDLRKLN
jgi:hypothetical protein